MIGNHQDKLQDLYLDGIVDFKKIFDNEFLLELFQAKNKLFKEFPYGQNDNLQKITDSKFFQRSGSRMVWDIIEREPVFGKILENKTIQEIANKVLGENYKTTAVYIRKTPNTDDILHPHIDQMGSLSFSILLDEIKENQGETFFYKKSHKYPPPPFCKFNSPNLKKDIIRTVGNLGDTFFWFPDCWHGRYSNKNNSETTILMCHMGNTNFPNKEPTGRKVSYGKKNHTIINQNRNSFLNKIFNNCGQCSNNISKHFIYLLLYFKFSKIGEKAIQQKMAYVRRKFGKKDVDDFSLLKYFKLIAVSRVIKIFLSGTIKLVFGRNFIDYLKKKFKKFSTELKS